VAVQFIPLIPLPQGEEWSENSGRNIADQPAVLMPASALLRAASAGRAEVSDGISPGALLDLCDDSLQLVFALAGPRGAPAVALLQGSRRCFSTVVCHRAAFRGPVQAWREATLQELDARHSTCGVKTSDKHSDDADQNMVWRLTAVLVRHSEGLRALNAWIASQTREAPSPTTDGQAEVRALCTRRESAELRRRVALMNAAAADLRARLPSVVGSDSGASNLCSIAAQESSSNAGWLIWATMATRLSVTDSPARRPRRLCLPATAAARAAFQGFKAAAAEASGARAEKGLPSTRARARRSRAAWRWAAELLQGDGSLAQLSARAELHEAGRERACPACGGA